MITSLYKTSLIINFKNFIKKKINLHEKKRIFYLRAIVHVLKFIFLADYRNKRCLIDPPSDFIYKYKYVAKFFTFFLLILSKYLKKKKIFISVHNDCNFSIGHIFCEIGELKRIQYLDHKYSGSKIWFTSTRKEILDSTKDIFEDKNFKVLFGGLKRLLLTLVAIKYPSISIDASLGTDNYIFSDKFLSGRIVYNSKSKKRARMITRSPEFYPLKEKLNKYRKEYLSLIEQLNIEKKYIVIHMKNSKTNCTYDILNPKAYIDTINYFKKRGYSIVLAGREPYPEIFYNYNIIDYANSKYATPFNDYLLVGNSSLVISSGSGFCNIAEVTDTPLLVINSFHGIQQFARRTILLPTLLSIEGSLPNAKNQHKYLCTFGQNFGHDNSFDIELAHMPTNDEILEASKELEEMIELPLPPFTLLQKKINNKSFPLISDGLSRISNYYLKKNANFF